MNKNMVKDKQFLADSIVSLADNQEFIEDPALFEIELPNVLEEIVQKIGYDNYRIVKQFLKSEGIEIIDLEDVIQKCKIFNLSGVRNG